MAFRHMRSLAVPAAAAASVAATTAAGLFRSDLQAEQPAIQVDAETAARLREVAMRSRASLQDPPRILTRCARSEWRTHATSEAMEALKNGQSVLRAALASAAEGWKSAQQIDPASVVVLEQATADAEAAVHAARDSAVAGAAAVPWHKVLGGTRLDRVIIRLLGARTLQNVQLERRERHSERSDGGECNKPGGGTCRSPCPCH